jgi:glutathione-regulated potassium-efflux system ancillary protein KefC
MHHFDVGSFLAAAIGLLGLTAVSLLVFKRIGVGSIAAFLIAGLAIGQIRDIEPESIAAVREFAEIGVILLLFVIGLEIQPSQLRRLGRDAAALGVPQIILSTVAIGLYAWWKFGSLEMSVVLGLSLALSSTIVVIQLLTDRKELHSRWGRKAFAILLAQDLAVVPVLLVVSLMAEQDTAGQPATHWSWAILRAGVAVVGIVVVGRFVLTRVLAAAAEQHNKPAFSCVAFLGIFAAALASERAGLSMALGTFLLGTTLSTSPLGHQIEMAVEPFKNLLLAVFFLSVGMSIDFDVVGHAWATLLLSTVVILGLKFAVVFGLALARGVATADALRLALALPQCGEFGFVVFGTAEAGNLMSAEASALASVVITISMVATPFLLRLGGAPSAEPPAS